MPLLECCRHAGPAVQVLVQLAVVLAVQGRALQLQVVAREGATWQCKREGGGEAEGEGNMTHLWASLVGGRRVDAGREGLWQGEVREYLSPEQRAAVATTSRAPRKPSPSE